MSIEVVLVPVVICLSIVVALDTVILLGLITIVHGDAGTQRADAELVGREAPGFRLDTIEGRELAIDRFESRQALLFVSPECGSCQVALSELERIPSAIRERVSIVCRGGLEDCSRLAAGRFELLLDRDGYVHHLYHVAAAPTLVLVGSDGRIESHGHPAKEDIHMLAVGKQALDQVGRGFADA